MIATALALLAATGATPAAKPGAAHTPTPAQVAARTRMQACSRQYQADKTAGKLPAGQTWPRYYSACSKKLKA